MAAYGVVPTQTMRYPTSCRSEFQKVEESRPLIRSVGVKQKKSSCGVLSCGFRDQGHLQYYNGCRVKIFCKKQDKGVKEIVKMKKKDLKLVMKGLRKESLAFADMAETADLLLEQLQKLKSQEKELKRKRKEEKSKLKAVHKLKDPMDSESSSSSSESSSESSDSDCEEVIDMKTLKQHPQENQLLPEQNIVHLISQSAPSVPDSYKDTSLLVDTADLSNAENNTCFETSTSPVQFVNANNENVKESVASASHAKKIEVCMGGKCKKSGATAILEEFQRVLGMEGSVSGCKCMGKCRTAPNVKVSTNEATAEDDSVRVPSNSLCIGVGLDDVSKIVANILGGSDDQNHIGFAASA